jgi:RNA polymerase sigma factor (sigma-70 family)
MSREESVTRWIRQLEAGNAEAAQPLWERYFQRMVAFARRRLPDHRRVVADEEDVALSAFQSFCRGVQHRRFAKLVNRDGLWPLLVAITAHKAQDLLRRQGRLKRGGDARQELLDWSGLLSQEPNPEFAARLTEELERLISRLDQAGDDDLARIVWASLEGETANEIADRLGCSPRTIQRKLVIIRRILEEGDEP